MWLLPSYGRPDAVKQFMEHSAKAPITLWLTQSDPKLDEYPKIMPVGWQCIIGPPNFRLADTLNHAFKMMSTQEFYGFIGDDVEPVGFGWWQLLEHKAKGGMSIPVDTIWGTRGSPHFCLDGEMVRAVGYLALPLTKHSFFDTAWFNLAKLSDRLFLETEVWFKHRHPLVTGADLDDTYSRGQETYEHDEKTFKAWVNSGRIGKDLERIAKAMGAVGPQEPANGLLYSGHN